MKTEGITQGQERTQGQQRTQEQQKTEEVWQAASRGNLQTLQTLIEYGSPDMTLHDGQHRTALWYGVESGDADTVRYLTERIGLNPLEADSRGITPWDLAYKGKNQEISAYFERRFGCSYEHTYHNPIRRGFFPDPSIVRVGEDYYMVNSTFVFFPCIPISHSRDLMHWTIIGYAITNPEWAHLDDKNGGMGYWAPDISYWGSRFYITATLRCNDDNKKKRMQMVTSSEKPEGPYEEPVFLDDDGIDPSIFHDDDGRKYMLLNRGARILELSRDCKRILSPGRLLWYGDNKRKPEGPHMLKHQGYYYLFLAEGGTGMGHCITVARAKEMMGPYEPSPYNPILHQWDEGAQIQCCGHGKPFQLPDGRWYIVYLCLRKLDGKYGILGRETALDPVTWTADGWPVINGGRGPSGQQRMPFFCAAEHSEDDASGTCESRAAGASGRNENAAGVPGRNGIAAGASGREGCGDSEGAGRITKPLGGYPFWKGQNWMTPRPLSESRIYEAQGCLHILGDDSDLNSKECRSILVKRQEEFSVEAVCRFIVPELEEGQSLGMTCYYDENSYIKYGVAKRDGRYGILLQEYVDDRYVTDCCAVTGETDRTEGAAVGNGLRQPAHSEICPGSEAAVKVRIEGLKRTFFFQMDGVWKETAALSDTSYLSSEGLNKGKRFTGAVMGIYVQGGFWGCFSEFHSIIRNI